MHHVNSSDANTGTGEDTPAWFTVGDRACTQSSTIMSAYKDLLMRYWSCPSPSHAAHSIGQGWAGYSWKMPVLHLHETPVLGYAGPVAALSICSRIRSWLAALILLFNSVYHKPFFPAISSSQLSTLDTAISTRLWRTKIPSSIST